MKRFRNQFGVRSHFKHIGSDGNIGTVGKNGTVKDIETGRNIETDGNKGTVDNIETSGTNVQRHFCRAVALNLYA